MQDPISISFNHYRAEINWMYVYVCNNNYRLTFGKRMSLKLLVVDVCTEAFINQNNYSNKLVVLNHQGINTQT